ncbi:MAG: hypothetical protein LKI03_08510 [Acetobacter indonesiensis]|nr:hypothetical protein [Acetobacter indonesiensis]MCI1766073.1 hypothetical protein [Acetobacter indonesiensis]
MGFWSNLVSPDASGTRRRMEGGGDTVCKIANGWCVTSGLDTQAYDVQTKVCLYKNGKKNHVLRIA